MSACPVCEDAAWVCENHEDRPWGGVSDSPRACECGAGSPCPKCNQCDERTLPRGSPGEQVIWDLVNGWRH